LIEAPAFFMDLLRYVEQQPVRAGLWDDPADYPWSSAAHHLGRRRDPLVHEHAGYWALGNTPFEREAKYRLAMAAPLPLAQLERVRRHVHSGWPLLTAEAAKTFELVQGRPSAPRKRGRPLQAPQTATFSDSDPI
jgi:putative transposase